MTSWFYCSAPGQGGHFSTSYKFDLPVAGGPQKIDELIVRYFWSRL